MQLYLLRPKPRAPGDDPWKPWYDKCFGFVIAAESVADARQLAHKSAGDENRGNFLGKMIANTQSPWLDEKYTSCRVLQPSETPEVIIRDFHAA